MCPQQPPLQKRSHAMHTRHQFVRRVVALAENGDLVRVAARVSKRLPCRAEMPIQLIFRM